jgi:LysM repeat protein
MNHPNPFVPKGSLLEQQTRRRSRLKLGVFCVLAVSVTGLVAMLIQGCKRENPDASNNPPVDTNPPVMDTNSTAIADTNTPIPMPPIATTNPPPLPPPLPVPPVADLGSSEYVVVAGDTLGKIAKEHGVSLKALEAANPGVDPKKLQIKQKLVIPASTKSTEAAPGATPGMADAGGETYVVKNNDTLGKIAKKYGVSVKALKAENNLTTDRINVGQKLKIPAKAEAAAPAPPPPDTTAAPVPPPAAAPAASVPAPAPGR